MKKAFAVCVLVWSFSIPIFGSGSARHGHIACDTKDNIQIQFKIREKDIHADLIGIEVYKYENGRVGGSKLLKTLETLYVRRLQGLLRGVFEIQHEDVLGNTLSVVGKSDEAKFRAHLTVHHSDLTIDDADAFCGRFF